jgi:hypothetical protein
MATAEAALALAATKVGVTEQPRGSNNVEFCDWYGIRGAWCAMFVSWVLIHSGVPIGPHSKGYAWCSDGERWFRDQGRLITDLSQIRPGDVLFFEWGSTAGGLDHTCFAAGPPDGAGNVRTLEGNVSDSVLYLTRNIRTSGIVSAGRPTYSLDIEEDDMTLQQVLTEVLARVTAEHGQTRQHIDMATGAIIARITAAEELLHAAEGVSRTWDADRIREAADRIIESMVSAGLVTDGTDRAQLATSVADELSKRLAA